MSLTQYVYSFMQHLLANYCAASDVCKRLLDQLLVYVLAYVQLRHPFQMVADVSVDRTK
jgi:hypothetical protein